MRKSYVRMLVDSVSVGEKQIEMRGSNAALFGSATNSLSVERGECELITDMLGNTKLSAPVKNS